MVLSFNVVQERRDSVTCSTFFRPGPGPLPRQVRPNSCQYMYDERTCRERRKKQHCTVLYLYDSVLVYSQVRPLVVVQLLFILV